MTEVKNDPITKEQLAAEAREYEEREAALVARLNGLPMMVKEAVEAARVTYTVAYHAWERGEGDEPPKPDYSEAYALEASEDELRREAHAAGLAKLEMYAMYWRAVQQERQAAHDALVGPVQHLGAELQRVQREYTDTRNAQLDADKSMRDARTQAVNYERALRLHKASDEPVRRMA